MEAVGDPEPVCVAVRLTRGDAVGEAVPVGLAVSETGVAVVVSDAVELGSTDPDAEIEGDSGRGVTEADTPCVFVTVPEIDRTTKEAVLERVAVLETVAVSVAVHEAVAVGVHEADAPCDIVVVDAADVVPVALGTKEPDVEADTPCVFVTVPEIDRTTKEAVLERVAVLDSVAVCVAVREAVAVGVPEADAPCDMVVERDAVVVPVTLGTKEPVAEADTPRVFVDVPSGVTVAGAVPVTEADADVGVSETELVSDGETELDSDGVATPPVWAHTTMEKSATTSHNRRGGRSCNFRMFSRKRGFQDMYSVRRSAVTYDTLGKQTQ